MKTAPWIIICVLIALLALQRECSHCPECPECPEIDTTRSVRVDSFAYPVISYRPTLRVPAINFVFPLNRKLTKNDSNAVFLDYFRKYFQVDTLANDSNLFVMIEDTISRNMVTWRRKTIRVYPRTVFETKFVSKQADPVRKMFVGMGVGRSVKQFGFAASVMYISRKDHAYTLSYDILNKDLYFTMYWKINFMKHE